MDSMLLIDMDSPYGKARLTKGLDSHGGQCITARWHRVKGNCEVRININMPNYQTAVPLEIWQELERLVSHFVESVATGSPPQTDETTEADFRELPALLEEAPKKKEAQI